MNTGSRFIFTFLAFVASLAFVAESRAKPIDLVWFEPRLSFVKDERVTYLMEYWYQSATGDTKAGPGRRISYRITDADPWAHLFTLGADRPEEAPQLKMNAGQTFDELSFLLAGSHVQPFQWYEQVRGLGITDPPPPQEPSPIQIGKRGEFSNRFEIIGEIKQLVGQKKFRARIIGWEIVEGWPCLKIEGIVTTSMNEGGPSDPPNTAEIAFSPEAGRIVKATLSRGGGSRTVIRWANPPTAPSVSSPQAPSSEGIHAVFPPLSKKARDASSGFQQALTRQDREEAVKFAGVLLADPDERGLVEHGKGWYWSLRTYVRDALRVLAPDFLASASTDLAERTLRRMALADAGAQSDLHDLVAVPPRFLGGSPEPTHQEVAKWQSIQLLTLSTIPVTPESTAGLYAAPVSSTLWLVRNHDLQPLGGSVDPARQVLQEMEEGDLIISSFIDDTPAQPDLRRWNPEGSRETAVPLALDFVESMAPWRVITDVRKGDFLYFLGNSSSGEHHLFLSAWDLNAKRWAFRHRWLTTLDAPEGGAKGVKLTSALSADRSALLCWFSTGLLVCMDARTGEMKWTRVLEAGLPGGSLPTFHASAHAAVGWFPATKEVWTFDLATGKELWRAKRPEGRHVIGLANNRVLIAEQQATAALEESLGVEVWRFAPRGGGEALSGVGLLTDGVLWIPFGTTCYALDAASGKSLSQLTRANTLTCRLLPDPKGADRLWVLTADRLEQFSSTVVQPLLP